MRTELLWRKGAAAEGTLLAAMVDLVAGLTGLSPSDRKLRDDLLGALRVLADGAEALRQKARAVRPDSLSAPRQTA